jgi:hypothetical protein
MARIIWLSTAIVLLTGSMSPEITPAPGALRVNAVFNKADVVCNCVVRTLKVAGERIIERAGSSLTIQHLTATVEIVEPYKADRSGRMLLLEFEKQIPPTLASLPEVQQGEMAVMFLRETASSYVFADPFLAAVPFRELPHQAGDLGLKKLQDALGAVLRLQNRGDQIHALELLEGFDTLSPDAIPTLTLLSHSSDPEIALWAFAVLLKAKDTEGLQEILGNLDAYLNSHNGESSPAALNSISNELRSIDNPMCLRSIETLAGSKLVTVRRGAMEALRTMKSPEAAATLAARLDDSDSYVRYLAVISLAETFGMYGDYAPNMQLFDQAPDPYTYRWKVWLAQRNSSK